MKKEKVITREYSYTVRFESSPDGGYVATVPALPAVITQGETLDEARAMAEDAIRLYLEYLVEQGESIPTDVDTQAVEEKVKIALQPA